METQKDRKDNSVQSYIGDTFVILAIPSHGDFQNMLAETPLRKSRQPSFSFISEVVTFGCD